MLAVLMMLSIFPIASFAAVKCPVCKKADLTGEVKTIPATCTEPEYRVYVCSDPNCPGKKEKYGAPASHTWEKDVDKKYLKDPAYCKGPATYYESCSKCGISAKDAKQETLTFDDPNGKPDLNNHRNLEVKKKEVPATCTSKGRTAIGKCRDCGEEYVGGEDIPMLPHTEGTPANCVDKAICKVCEKAYGEVNPENHKSLKKDEAKTATCVETGLTEGEHCEACKRVIKAQEKVPLTDHTPKSANKEPTCTEEGVQGKMVCAVCDKVIEAGEVLPAKGHTWGNWTAPAGYKCENGGTLTRTCTVCKEKDTVNKKPGEHADVVDKAVEPTCVADGKEEGSHCGICKTVIKEQVTIPALGHDFTGDIVANKDGTHGFKCTRCKETGGNVKCTDFDRNCVCDQCGGEIPHVFSSYKPDGNATCKEDGTKTAICDICGKAKDTKPDEGSKDTAEHKYKFESQNDATCTTNAHEVGTCSLCGATITREVENSALGHDASDWKYEEGFNCELGGKRFKVCSRCGEEIDPETVPAGEHKRVYDAPVKETCTTDGKTEGSHCSVCGEIFTTQGVIPAPGHKADANGFTTEKAPSCEKAGTEKATCSVCGQSFTREIPKTGHKYAVTVVPPTCTAKGYSLHKCSVCGDSYKDSTKKATGHSWKITVKPATMKKNGTKAYVCKSCGKKVNKTIDKIKTVKLASTELAKTGKKVTPTLIIKNSAGKKLKEGTAYKLKYSGACKKLGTYKVTITFIGNYKDKKTLSFKIVPAAPKTVKSKVNSKDVTLSWSNVSGGDQFVVLRSTSKSGTYKKVGTTDERTLTDKSLKAGTYYYKVRAYNEANKLNGILSAPVKVKVK